MRAYECSGEAPGPVQPGECVAQADEQHAERSGLIEKQPEIGGDGLQDREHQPPAGGDGQQHRTGRAEPAATHPEADPHHRCPFRRPRRRQPPAVELHAHRRGEQRERDREGMQGGVGVARPQPPREPPMHRDEPERR